jgi:flagellar biosynthesis GTPase FlhF
MPEMPIPQDYNRFINGDDNNGLLDNAMDDESINEILSQDESDVEELPDGSAIVKLEDLKGPDENPDFYENLADSIDSWELNSVALKYLDLIEKDKEAREDRDKQYEEGIRRTGLGHDAPGGAQFMGASKVVHPIMAESCVDFAARAIKELFPADGPVKTKIIGEVTEEKTARAERKRDYMNWQLTEQIEEYRDEQEQMLTQLPLGGSQYMKMWWDEQKRRPCAEFVPIDNIYLPFAAVNFYTAMRVTEVQDITQEQFELRVSSGLYIDLGIYRSSEEPKESKAQKANDKVEGRKDSGENIDGIRRVFHIQTWLELEEDNITKGERAPYILMIDENESAVVGLYRNWEDGDETYTKLDWIIEFKFIPWRGAYAIGLPHLIGGLSAALTGSLRALLDSAHINNAPTMLKLKGAKISGQSTVIEPTQVAEIEGAPGVDDVRKIAMPVPFNPPSQVLFELMGWLTDQAKGVVTTSEEKIADVTSNSPVGTTQALIEQGAAVFSSIHSRLHDSQRRVFKVLGRLNRWYLDDQRKTEVVEDLQVTPEDFITNSDIIPVSDPHIFAESQRYAQIQTLASRAEKNPDLYNRLAVEKRILKQIKLPDINEVLPDPQDVKDMNPALENVSMTLGKPVGAFPAQDHLAHFISHIQFAQDPIFGGNPIIAPAFIPACLEHLKQHLTLWYLGQADRYTSEALGKPYNILKIQPTMREAQKLLAVSLQHVHMDSKEVLSEVGKTIAQMLDMMKKMQQNNQQIDPSIKMQIDALTQTQMAETQRKAAKDQADMQYKMQDMQIMNEEKQDKIVSDQQIKAAEITHDINTMTLEQQFAAQEQQAQHERQMQMQMQQQQAAQQQAQATQQPPQQPPQPPQGAGNV